MNRDKIYNALQSLPLPIEQKNILIDAFMSEGTEVEQTEVLQEEDIDVNTLKDEVKQLRESFDALKKEVKEKVLPSKATKDNEGLVRAITDIRNLEVSTATIPIVVGAINTLLVNLRTAGIIQM